MLTIRPTSDTKPVSPPSPNSAPPSEHSTVSRSFQTGSMPKLSYTPPSLKVISRIRLSRLALLSYPGEIFVGSRFNCNGLNTGGKHDEAATAVATSQSAGVDWNPA